MKSKLKKLKTKFFLDSCSVNETKIVKKWLGFLDGQTTNPTLLRKKLGDKRFKPWQLLLEYKNVVKQISKIIPKGSVSVEVYADKNTTSDEMLWQAREMFGWIPNAHIKLPTNHAGLIAANKAVSEGLRVNMTLVFSQRQARAVYAATENCENVLVSPFIGRLEDHGWNGVSLVKNILKMFSKGDGHVKVLAASIRNVNHLLACIQLGVDMVTAPFKVFEEWRSQGYPLPSESFVYEPKLKVIKFENLDLNSDWRKSSFKHSLLVKGLEKFSKDWNSLTSFQCKVCGYNYTDKKWAEKCEQWCSTHNSCSNEITKHGFLSF